MRSPPSSSPFNLEAALRLIFLLSLSFCQMVLAAQRSELRHRTANFLQQRPRAVPIAPTLDVGPVELFALHADHGAHIVLVAASRPPDLHNDHILGRRQPDLSPVGIDRHASLKTS